MVRRGVWSNVFHGRPCLALQLRIHDSQGVDFYVAVASGPIIEDCSGLRFAPSRLEYPQHRAHLQASNLNPSRTLR